MALTDITATTGVEVRGQLLALNGAVTLDTNVIRNDLCEGAGSLRVTKEVVGPVGDMTLPDFEITVTGPFAYSDTQTIAAGDSYTWEDLGSGLYTVSEGALGDDWDVSGTGEYEVVLGEMTDVTLTNTYTGENGAVVGALTVTKVVTGDTSGVTVPSFSITVTGPESFSATRTFAHNESYTWGNLVPGTYTVTEDKAGFSSEWTVSGEGTIQIAAGQPVARTITNRFVEAVSDDDDGLPKTGGDPLVMTYAGFILAGLGYMLKRKRA
jgi:LPXTG-motif cell wall-anchored protein